MRMNRLTVGVGAVALALLALAVPAMMQPAPAVGQNQYNFPVRARASSTQPALWVRQSGAGVALLVEAVPTTTPGVNGSAVSAISVAKSGVTTFSKPAQVSGNNIDLTLNSPTDGGNGNVANEFVGVPKLRGFVAGTMTNGAAAGKTVTGYIDETPAGEWTASTNGTDATDSSVYRKGTASLSLALTSAAVATNGMTNTLSGGNEDWSDDESFGFWHRCSSATSAGDLVLRITDSVAGATSVNIPALATADKWSWVEVNIGGVTNTSKDVLTDISIQLSSAGATAHGALTCYFDYAYKWDSTEEEAIGQNIYEDGLVALYATATLSSTANTPALLAEGTDYFVHYESGNDFVVTITDQSANSGWGVVAAQ